MFRLAEIMLAELADDFRARAHAIVRTWLLGDLEGLVAWVGDDALSCCGPGTRVKTPVYYGGRLPAGFLAYSPDRS